MTSPSKTMNQCSASDCAAPVAPGLLFCRECWPLIPMEHKLAMVEAYRPLTERHLPLQRAVLVAKHREAVLTAGRAIVRPPTAPEPEIHLCPGEAAPEFTRWACTHEWEAFPPPLAERLGRLSPPVRRGVMVLLSQLVPCWDQGLAPARDAAMSVAQRNDAAMAAIAGLRVPLLPSEWGEALAVLIREGIVAERLYGRVTHQALGAS